MAVEKLLKLIDDAASFKIKPNTLKSLESLDGGAEAVAKLKKGFDLTALEDGKLFAKPKPTDELIGSLEAEAGHLTQSIVTRNDFTAKYLNGEVPGGDSPITHAFNTSSQISGVTLPQQMLNNWQKLNEVSDLINVKLRPQEFDLMPNVSEWGGQKIKNAAAHLFLNPKYAFGQLSRDLVVKPTELNLLANKYGKHSRGVWKKLTKSMSNEDIGNLNRILEAGNDAEEVFKPVSGGLKGTKTGFIEASDKVQEAYFGTRMLMDHMYWLNNTAAVRQARSKNFKLLEIDGKNTRTMVQKVKGRHGESYPVYAPKQINEAKYVKWGKELEEEGFEVIEFVSKEGQRTKLAMSKEHATSMLREIDDGYDLIGYRTGYVPVLYEDSWAVNKLVRMKDGTFRASRIATAPTRVKANKSVEIFQKQVSLAEDEVEHIYIASRKNDISTDAAYGQNLHNIIDNMSTSELSALKKALVEMGLEPEIVDTLEGTARFFSHKRNPYMMKRGQRLKDWTGENKAATLPADAAIQKYLQSSSSYAANADYIGKLETAYLREFGELLTDPTDFLSPLRRMNTPLSSNGRSAHEANVVRSQIKRISGIASDQDRIVENYITAGMDKLADTRTGKVLNTVLDKMADTWGLRRLVGTPSPSRAIARIKGFTATAKLGLWNMSQAVVQGTAALNVIGKNPIFATAATGDIMKALAPEIMKVGRTAEGRRLFNLIDDSGFIAGFDYVELQRVAAKGTDKLFGSRALRKVWDTNLIPYHLGEGGVRALAWFTERRVLIDQIRKGLSELTEAEIDSAKFLQRVNEQASITALNMSRVNQPLVARGFWGVPLQFKQFLIQQSEFLFNSKNFGSFGEQARVWGAWVGAFGIQGMPWMFDITIMAEHAAMLGAETASALGIDVSAPKYAGAFRRMGQEMSDSIAKAMADTEFSKAAGRLVGKKKYDDARAFWNRWMQSGFISAATDGELNIASRASLARVFTEYYGTQTLDDLLFGPGYQTAVMLIHNNVGNIKDLSEIWRNGDEFTPNYLLGAAARSTRGLPGLKNPLVAAETMLSGQWRDTERRLIKDEVSLTQSLLIGAGFQPAQRGERFERIEFTDRQKQAWREWLKGRVGRIAQLSMEGHTNYATVLLNDSLEQIEAVNPLIARDFMTVYANEMLRRNMSDDAKEVLYRAQDSVIFDSPYDRFFFERDTYIGIGDQN